MLSPEFNAAIKSGNLLRTRIMLKDSLIVDPTFAQFNELLAQARRELPNLLVPHDGEILEDDKTKWNTDLMNTELVEIVHNFSEVRIDHLKKVIAVVMADNIRKASMARSIPPDQRQQKEWQGGASAQGTTAQSSALDIEKQKKDVRQDAFRQIINNSNKIGSIMKSIHNKGGKYGLSDIQKLENAANQIISAARTYKNNR